MRRYSLLIADDNISTANGLHDMISSEFSNVDIVNVCSNGEHVIKFLKENFVDIMILDVQMPAGTGIDVLKYIHDNMLDIKTIMITGYTKFEYAVEAIKYQVSDFITKPINQKQMIQSIREVIAKIEEDVYKAQMQTNNILESYKFIKSNVKMVYYGYKIQNQSIQFGNTHSNTPVSQWQSALIELDFNSGENTNKNTIVVWSDLFDDMNDSINSFCVYEEAELVKIFILSENKDSAFFDNAVKKYITDCVNLAKSVYKLECTVNYLWKGKFGEYNVKTDLEKLVNIYRKYLDTSNMLAKNDFIDLIKTSNLSTAQNFALDLLNSIVPETNESYLKIKKEITRSGNQNEVLIAISEIDKVYFSVKQNGKDIIHAIKDYIINHYDKDMTLNSIATEFNVSPYYLSKLFRQKSSQGFSEYVVLAKISKAKKLLADKQYSINEVASMVGYSTDYFRKVFKEQVGISPGEYSKIGLKNRL